MIITTAFAGMPKPSYGANAHLFFWQVLRKLATMLETSTND
jgi:hypothetical protein